MGQSVDQGGSSSYQSQPLPAAWHTPFSSLFFPSCQGSKCFMSAAPSPGAWSGSVIPSGPLAGLPVELAPYADAATGLLTKAVVVQIKTQAFPVPTVRGAGPPIPPLPPSLVSITVGVGRSIAEVKVRMEKGAVLTDPFVPRPRRRRHTPMSTIKPETMEEAAKKVGGRGERNFKVKYSHHEERQDARCSTLSFSHAQGTTQFVPQWSRWGRFQGTSPEVRPRVAFASSLGVAP